MRVLGVHLASLERVDWREPTPSMQPRPWSTWALVVGPRYRRPLAWKTGSYEPYEVPRCRICGVEPGSAMARRPCLRRPEHQYAHPSVYAAGMPIPVSPRRIGDRFVRVGRP